MILLDTNVISAVMQARPPAVVVAWLDGQAPETIWTTAITVFEIEYGLARLPAGKRRTALEDAFRVALTDDLGGRVLSFDVPAAIAAGHIAAALESAGRPVDVRDVQIAGIARARSATVATRNVKRFEGTCETIDPWTSRP